MNDRVPFHLTVAGRRCTEHQPLELLRLLVELKAQLKRVADVMGSKVE